MWARVGARSVHGASSQARVGGARSTHLRSVSTPPAPNAATSKPALGLVELCARMTSMWCARSSGVPGGAYVETRLAGAGVSGGTATGTLAIVGDGGPPSSATKRSPSAAASACTIALCSSMIAAAASPCSGCSSPAGSSSTKSAAINSSTPCFSSSSGAAPSPAGLSHVVAPLSTCQ